MSAQPKSKPSGEHPIVLGMRKKLESIRDGELPEVEKFNERLKRIHKRVRSSNPPPHHDPRREPDDESEIPEDVVTLPKKEGEDGTDKS